MKIFKGICSSRNSRLTKFRKAAQDVGLYVQFVHSKRKPAGINARTYFLSNRISISSIEAYGKDLAINGTGYVRLFTGECFDSGLSYILRKDDADDDSRIDFVRKNAHIMDISGFVRLYFHFKDVTPGPGQDEHQISLDPKSDINDLIGQIADASIDAIMYGNPTAYSLDFVKISDRHNHHILLDRTGRTKPAIYMNQ